MTSLKAGERAKKRAPPNCDHFCQEEREIGKNK
jgi:hypothetical protein